MRLVRKIRGREAQTERLHNLLKGFRDFRTENGSGSGQNLALTGTFIPSSLGSGCRVNHQQPEVNYLPSFENDDLPCRLHEKNVVCRVNHRSRNRVNSSLQVAGGRHAPRARGRANMAHARPSTPDLSKSTPPYNRQLIAYYD